jgi:hypothetical protein
MSAEGRVALQYDRSVLVAVLKYHSRKNSSICSCGWAELGRSHPEHIADVYEQLVAVQPIQPATSERERAAYRAAPPLDNGEDGW